MNKIIFKMKLMKYLFIFLIWNGPLWASEDGYIFEPALINLHLLDIDDIGDTYGMVLDTNNSYLGTYVDPYYPAYDEKIKKLKNLLLFKAVQLESMQLSNEADTNFQISLAAKTDVDNAIEAMDVTNKMLNRFSNLLTQGIKVLARDFVDNYIDIINEGLDCKYRTIQLSQTQESMCLVINNRLFNFAKDIMYTIVDDYWQKGAQASIGGMTKLLGSVFRSVTFGLQAGSISNNFLSAWIIEKNTSNLYDMSIMLSSFTNAYLYFDQDIHKFKDFITVKSLSYNYTMPTINSFSELFFHYIQLRRNTGFGKYSLLLKREINSSNLLENINMEVAPVTAQIMLEHIEKYGNGGNFVFKLLPKINSKSKLFDLKIKKTSADPLYISYDKENIFLSENKYSTPSYWTILPRVSVNEPVKNLKGECGITSSSVNPPENYKVNIHSESITRSVHRFSLDINCDYMMENSFGSIYLVSSKLLKLSNIYTPEIFPDVDVKHWSSDSIGELLEQGVIKGDALGYFKPKNNITMGEFFKMISIALYGNIFRDTGYTRYFHEVEETGYISWETKYENKFAPYMDFLLAKKINISTVDNIGTSTGLYELLNYPVTREYVAKVLNNILAEHKSSINLSNLNSHDVCSNQDENGWDECSATLRFFNIVKGSKKINSPADLEFRPKAFITRDEFSIILTRTQEVAIKIQKPLFQIECLYLSSSDCI